MVPVLTQTIVVPSRSELEGWRGRLGTFRRRAQQAMGTDLALLMVELDQMLLNLTTMRSDLSDLPLALDQSPTFTLLDDMERSVLWSLAILAARTVQH